MSKSLALVLVALLMASCITSVKLVNADSNLIVVPDDYATLVDAIANANNGDTIFIKEGNYEGPINQTITIDKTLSIIGESPENTIINLHPAWSSWWILTAEFFNYSDAIAITSNDFNLLNLTLIIANPGGYISSSGDRTQIIGNKITSGPTTTVKVNGSYCRITDNVMGGAVELNGNLNEVSRNTLYSLSAQGEFNTIRDNTCEFLYLLSSRNTVITGNNVVSTTRGYAGIFLGNSEGNFLFRNKVSEFACGVELWNSANNMLTANTIFDSLTTLRFGNAFNNRICLNNFENLNWWDRYFYDSYADPWVRDGDPEQKLSNNFWDNGSVGNYWGNYNGSDLNGDGIGDVPYNITITINYFEADNEEVVCGIDNFPLMAPVNIDTLTIELPEWALNLPPAPPELNLPTPSPATTPSPAPTSTPDQTPPPSPTNYTGVHLTEQEVIIIVAIAVAGIGAGLGLLIYFKKRKH